MDFEKRTVLDEFGRLLMAQVRDDACDYLQRVISGKMADKASKEVFGRFRRLTSNDPELIEILLLQAVDAGIVRFLHFLDEFEIGILFQDHAGGKHDIRAISDGLAGELYTEDGWAARFSSFKDRIEPLE